MARPNRQTERRAALVAAAHRTIIERGFAGLKLRDIAESAGTSSSAVLYYFPTLEALLKEAQRNAIERFCVARARSAAAVDDPRRRLLTMIRSGLPTDPGDELCRLLYELGAVARRDPAYAARHVDLYQRQVAIYVEILEAGSARGVFQLAADALTIARNLVVLEDGYGLHLVMARPTFTVATAERMIRRYAELATGCKLRGGR